MKKCLPVDVNHQRNVELIRARQLLVHASAVVNQLVAEDALVLAQVSRAHSHVTMEYQMPNALIALNQFQQLLLKFHLP